MGLRRGNSLVIQNCTIIDKDLDVRTSARLTSVTVKDVEARRDSYGRDLTLPDCDTATVDNFTGSWLFINKDGPIAPAQKAVIKNSKCWNNIYAKDISISENSNGGSFYNFDTISLSSVTADTSEIYLYPAASASVKIEDCRLGSITIGNTQNGILKLKNVDITDLNVKKIEAKPYVITERLSCSKNRYNNTRIGSLKLPACSVTMKYCYFTGEVDVSCNEKDFKDIMEAVPVHTDIANVTAKTLKCGYITDTFRAIKRKYSCPPYVFNEGNWKNIFKEPIPFASGGSHNLKNVKVEDLRISSGDSITLKNSRLDGLLRGALSFALRKKEDENYTYDTSWMTSSVVLNNETTLNSKIDIDDVYVEGEWFRARTNTLSVNKMRHVWREMGCVELQGNKPNRHRLRLP